MLEIKHLSKKYDEMILDDISVKFPSHGLVVINGNSGCGKSTLLHIIAGLDHEYDGEILYNEKNIKSIHHYIRKHIGFIFQNMYLIYDLKVKENYLLPSYFKKIYPSFIPKYFNKLNLTELHLQNTSLLSGGQKQRIAILRSLICDSSMILCDEPTGSLDQKNSEQVFSILKDLAKEKLVIVVSHDLRLSHKYGHYLYRLENHQLHLLKSKPCQKEMTEAKTSHKPFFLLLLKLFKISFKTNLLLIQILFLSMFCILFTFSLTQSARNEIHQQIEQFIPSTTIMCKRKDNQDISIQELNQFNKDYIQYHCMEYENIEMLGLSLESKMDVNNTLYISDYIQNCKYTIIKGEMFQKDDEVVLSNTTYKHLCQLFNQKSLLNKQINLFLQDENQILSIPVTITGICKHNTAIDTLYLKEDAYSHFCQQLFQITSGQMCFLQVDNSQNIESLKKDYPQYQFQIANANMTSSIDNNMKQLENILLCFCFLAIISSCFLLGEVIYLHVIKRKKMFAIFKAMGASSMQITIIVLSQGLFVTVIGYIQAVLILKQLVSFINDMVEKFFMISSNHFFTLDKRLFVVVLVISIILTIISCYIPVKKANRIDIIQGIKG